jgi:hypothetical protein
MADELMGMYDEYADVEGDDDDIMGDDDDIMGDELMGELELVGRAAKRRKRALRRGGYSRDRGLLLGFGSKDITSGDTQDFLANPQVPFRPKRIIIDPATNIAVQDIKVGKNSQLVSANSFPAVAFQANAFDIGIKFDTAYPGIDITVTLTNNGAGTATGTTVGMFGFAAER